MSSVILFGPTGSVGSIAARTAEEHGATVWLAMRDTSKVVPGLSAEQEKHGRYERVYADLDKPGTLFAAVQTSGAKRAFIYRAPGSPDHMKSALQALRSAGIEFIVFLSSFTVNTEPRDIAPSEIIPYNHAQIEVPSRRYGMTFPNNLSDNLIRKPTHQYCKPTHNWANLPPKVHSPNIRE